MREIFIIIWRRKYPNNQDVDDDYDTSENYNTLEEAEFEVKRTDSTKWEFIKIVTVEVPDNR